MTIIFFILNLLLFIQPTLTCRERCCQFFSVYPLTLTPRYAVKQAMNS